MFHMSTDHHGLHWRHLQVLGLHWLPHLTPSGQPVDMNIIELASLFNAIYWWGNPAQCQERIWVLNLKITCTSFSRTKQNVEWIFIKEYCCVSCEAESVTWWTEALGLHIFSSWCLWAWWCRQRTLETQRWHGGEKMDASIDSEILSNQLAMVACW